MPERGIFALLATLLLATSVPAYADQGPDWTSGQAAFAAGDYRTALRHFEAARDQGLDGPAVHYNIAVCQFSLGQFAAARDTFGLIAGRYPRMRGLAEYNIGLAERRLGDNVAALRHFIRAFELSPDDEKIRSLAYAMVRDTAIQKASAWYGIVGLRAGHDDNVALRDDTGLPAGVTADSPLVDLYGAVRGPFPGTSRFLLDASLYVLEYPDADDYSQTEMHAGGLYTWQNDDWWLEVGPAVTFGTVGGSAFNREIGLEVRAVRYLDESSSFEIHLRHDDISGSSSRFAGIDGDRQRLELRYRYTGAHNQIAVRAGFEANDRTDPAVSPARKRIQLAYRYIMNDAWQLEAGVMFRRSDYDDLAPARDEDLISLTTGVTRSFGDAWQLSIAWQSSENDASDPDFAYDRNLVMLGLYRSF